MHTGFGQVVKLGWKVRRLAKGVEEEEHLLVKLSRTEHEDIQLREVQRVTKKRKCEGKR